MSELREVPDDAHTAARRAFSDAAGLPLIGLFGGPLHAAVNAAARPIQTAVLRQFITARQGCLVTIVAVLAIAVDLALYVGIALYVDGWLRWLAVAAFTLTVAIQVLTRMWTRRTRRRAAVLLAELDHDQVA